MGIKTYSGQEYSQKAEEGDIIEIPQYKNQLCVTSVTDTAIGVEFSSLSQRNSTPKTMIINENSNKLYLIAGNQDKGEVKTVDLVRNS